MPQTGCTVCEEPANVEGMVYRCAYCGNPVCPSHRLPENHGCSGERLSDDESPDGRKPKAMELSNTQTLGTAPDLEETIESSPDVAVDGSVATAESDDTGDVQESKSWLRRLIPSL